MSLRWTLATKRRDGMLGYSLKNVTPAICIFLAGCAAAQADCSYGDSSEPENSEIKRTDNQVYLCLSGRWARVSDIPAVVTIEKANLWTGCCGSANETDFVKAACNDKVRCSVPPSQSWAGAEADPSRRKHLWVSYHCTKGPKDLPTSHYAKQVEEDASLNISCRDFNFYDGR